jgi:hypothetical protein
MGMQLCQCCRDIGSSVLNEWRAAGSLRPAGLDGGWFFSEGQRGRSRPWASARSPTTAFGHASQTALETLTLRRERDSLAGRAPPFNDIVIDSTWQPACQPGWPYLLLLQGYYESGFE